MTDSQTLNTIGYGVPTEHHLRFGIPSLDDLFGTYSLSHRGDGIPVSSTDEKARLAIIGPAGSGKSLLALHLASRYIADGFTRSNGQRYPKVVYLSSDLTLEKAVLMWDAFRLNRPNLREVPFYRSTAATAQMPIPAEHLPLRVHLQPLEPNAETNEGMAGFLRNQEAIEHPPCIAVGFLDMLTSPVGDAWAFTSHLLAQLKHEDDSGLPLIFVDNVDGFEAQVGEVNSFGEPSSIRARIMQVVKAARKRAHLVFICEEEGSGTPTLVEESDVLVRLHIQNQAGYLRRTLEVQKARAQAIHRGEHPLVISTGSGSTTGFQENADDPRTTNAYIQVIPSLHTVSRRVMSESTVLESPLLQEGSDRAGFGLPYLDELCGGMPPYSTLEMDPADGGENSPSHSQLSNDAAGLTYGSMTGIIGDSNTYKSPLTHKFLLRPFELFAKSLNELYRHWGARDCDRIIGLGREIGCQIQGRKKQRDGTQRPLKKNPAREYFEEFKKIVRVTTKPADESAKVLAAATAAELLLYGRTGRDDIWSKADVERALLAAHDHELPGELVLLVAQWAAQLVRGRLLSLLVECPIDRFFKNTISLAEQTALRFLDCQNLAQLLRDKGEFQWAHLLEAAGAIWKSQREGTELCAMEQYEFEKTVPLKAVANVLALLRNVDELSTAERPLFDDVTLCVRKEYFPKDICSKPFEFLRNLLPGSTAYLTGKQVQKLKQMSPALDETVDSELSRRIVAGIACCWISGRIHEDEGLLREWLAAVPHLQWRQPLDLRCFLEALYRSIKSIALSADWHALVKHLAHADRLRKLVPPHGQACDWKWADLLPHVVFGDSADGLERFSEWLFQLSPRTHPYALASGDVALAQEILEISQRRIKEGPVFCSTMVAGILRLIHDHHLELEGHIEDELKGRRKAAESFKELQKWYGNYVRKGLPQSPQEGCLNEIDALVNTLIGNDPITNDALAKRLAHLRTAVCKLQGYYFKESEPKQIEDTHGRIQFCRLLLEAAARERHIDGPVVLITTKDVRLETLRDRYAKWLGTYLCNEKYDQKEYEEFCSVAKDHLMQWTVVRRLEVHYLDSAGMAAIIRTNVEAAQAVVFANTEYDDPENEHKLLWTTNINIRRSHSAKIRVAIDGLTAMRQTRPNVVEDPLFLQGLRFYVDRENLTTIVVSSQKGMPLEAGDERFERNVIDLLLNQIRVWRVLFFGELRVAVSVIPPPADQGSARVRELALRSDGELEVSPHFELYKNLERGQPEAVKLEVRLGGENKMLAEYQKSLDAILAQTFPTTANSERSQVVRAQTAQDWVAQLRDFGRLHRESHLEHSLILQVDEYWSFGRADAFRPQAKYLYSPCTDEPGLHRTDPLEVFQPTLADPRGDHKSSRHARFDWSDYDLISREKHRKANVIEHTDRVPFMWDFGFLLCDARAWKAERDLHLNFAEKRYGKKSPIQVENVWSALKKVSDSSDNSDPDKGDKPDPNLKDVPLNSWRIFLEAAVEVASRRTMSNGAPAPALDLSISRGESLVCLILEMWASEVYRKYFQRKEKYGHLIGSYFERFTRRSWLPSRTQGVIGLLAEPEARGANLTQIFTRALAQKRLPDLQRHSMELYKVLILLREAFDVNSIVPGDQPFRFLSRPVSPEAVAARHWYTTACEFLDGTEDAERYEAVRLPGNFSVRGDLYLAVARGSQSSLLADRALDLLSSRRGNHERLRAGLGLPVRDVADEASGDQLRTRLPKVDPLGRRSWVSYRELRSIGAPVRKPDEDAEHRSKWEEDEFHWLWRSTLGDYDAQARALHAGIFRIMEWWKHLRVLRSPKWRSGFELYDAIERYYALDERDIKGRRDIFEEHFEIYSLWEFPAICDELIDRLRHATPQAP